MGGTRLLTQKALHTLTSQRTVSYQEASHMIDQQDLVVSSDSFTYVSLQQGALLHKDNNSTSRDVVTRYRNRPSKHHNMSLETYFYKVFCNETFRSQSDTERTKHRLLVPKGLNCKPRFPIDYDYARGMLIMHKPWNKDRPLTKLLSNKTKTIQVFERMLRKNLLPSAVVAQHVCAVKYAHQKRLEIVAKKGTQESLNLDDLDDDEADLYVAHQQLSHFSDGKAHNDQIGGVDVDIGMNLDWTTLRYSGTRNTTCDGKDWMHYLRSEHKHNRSKEDTQPFLPKLKDGTPYKLSLCSKEQRQIICAAVDTVIKFLTNSPSYRPLRATVMGCGGTGKSFIINTITAIVKNMTQSNDTVQVAAPTGSAAYNVQGSTLHHLLGINVAKPELPPSKQTAASLKEQLERLLVLVIDERSQINSKVLAAAERNTRECVYHGQNSNELWGGLPVVLLFGDDYQLMPVLDEGAIQGFAKQNMGCQQNVTDRMSASQLFAYQGSYLFINVMTENVFALTKNYRVKCKTFRSLLSRLRVGEPNHEDAKILMGLHRSANPPCIPKDIDNKKCMYLFANNAEKAKKNNEKLISTSKQDAIPIARLDAWFESNKLQGGKERVAVQSHFNANSYLRHTDICVGAQVAIRTVNYLPAVGLYNGAIGKVVEIVYRDDPVGPNDKQNCHLPDYVVVDFPHLNLPSTILPWDKNNPTVSHPLTSACFH